MTVWTSNEAHLEVINGIAEAYRAAHPDTVGQITIETIPGDDYTTGLTTQIAGDNPPDLAWILEERAPEFIESGALLDLTPALQQAEGYDFEDLSDNLLELWRRDDALYAYPFSNSPFGVFVNSDLISQAGQPDPATLVAQGRWTWDAAREIATATAAASGRDGLIVRDFNYTNWQYLAEIWNGWGAAPWSADGQRCTFTEPAMVEAMSWLHEATFADDALPGPGTTSDFFAGDAAMTVTQISRASLLEDSFAWDLVPLPAGPANDSPVIGQAGIGVLANGDHPEIAADFLAFFSNVDNAAALGRFFPTPRESLLTAENLTAANPQLSTEQLTSVVIDGLADQDAATIPSHQNFAQLREQVRATLDPMWQPDADVPAVLGAVCDTITPTLAQ